PNPAYSPPAPSYTITWETPAPLQVYFSVVIATGSQVPSNAVGLVQQAIVTAFQGGVALFTASISGNLMTVSAIEQGAIAVGQLLSGGGVTQGTLISALGTGSGGIGTYYLSDSQNVASTLISSSPPNNTPVPARARIGSVIYANQYGALVGALGSWAAVKSIAVGSNNTAGAVVVGSVSGATLTVTAVTSGALAVDQFVSGGDAANLLPAGTTIVSFGSGSGGTGTYTLSNTLTLAGATFTGTRNAADQITASAVTGIIAVGDVIAGTGIPTGTTVISQISGTAGGAGIYGTSADTTASSASVTCAVSITAAAANQNYVSVDLNQEPQIGLSNILVTFS
ncbi:MAG: hypothetical protein ACRELF_04585, partial [Gemmataceae bacterium]